MKSASILSFERDSVSPRRLLRLLGEGLLMAALLVGLFAAVLAVSVCVGLLGRQLGPDGESETATEITGTDVQSPLFFLP